ncbi:MAG: hypothetical protein ABIO70_11890 [Pseudomonadota bacterium]
MPDPLPNRVCEALGVPPILLDAYRPARSPSLFHWMILALVERGEPMTIDEIAARLEALGVTANTGDLVYSLRKAWHGLKPVYQDARGMFGLDLQDWHIRHVLWETGLLETPRREPVQAAPPSGGDDPVTLEEVQELCERGISSSMSMLRVTAAVLEALGRAMTLDEVNAWIGARLRYGRFHLQPASVRGWRSDLVRRDEGDRLSLDPSSPDLPAMRRAIHTAVHPHLVRKAEREWWAQWNAEREAREAIVRQRQAEEAAQRRHALLHLVPTSEAPAAGVLLDVENRSFQTFTDLAAWPGARALDGFDVVVGVGVRNALLSLGADPDHHRLVDLGPPQKTRKLNKAGRKLSITTGLLIRGSVGTSLGDPGRIAGYLQQGDHRRLAARLEADAKALFAYWTYGRLHGCVRLRWGFLDENLSVEWALPGDPGLYEILREARAQGRDLEVVVGSAPGWKDPWARRRPAEGSEDWAGRLCITMHDSLDDVPLEQIQAVRLAGPRVTDT